MQTEKKRAVAYIRVSSKKAEQIHSFDFQESYWKNALENDDSVELTEIYADKGISGCSIYNRPQFMNMMQDAKAHKFDVIYTKSVSRFARNSVELLNAVRELRDENIEVVFETENIRTLEVTSDLYLTVAAAIAENDLKVDSERQIWSIQNRYQNGWISIGNGMLGYKMCEGNRLEIVPEEAEIVKTIFNQYLAGKGSVRIARMLNEQGKTTVHGNKWTEKSVIGILSNEKYCGDSIMGKQANVNGKREDNLNGEYRQKYYIPNSHEGIVSKETFQKAKEIRERRNTYCKDHMPAEKYPFTGMIECGQCHSTYHHKINNSGKKWMSEIWVCGGQHSGGLKRCDCTRIKDDVLKEKFVECYNEFIKTRPVGNLEQDKQEEIERIRDEMRELSRLALNGLISVSDYNKEKDALSNKLLELKIKKSKIRSSAMSESDFAIIDRFDKNKVNRFITKVIINKNMVTFVFYNGAKLSRPYTNGQAGNQKGWNKINRR